MLCTVEVRHVCVVSLRAIGHNVDRQGRVRSKPLLRPSTAVRASCLEVLAQSWYELLLLAAHIKSSSSVAQFFPFLLHQTPPQQIPPPPLPLKNIGLRSTSPSSSPSPSRLSMPLRQRSKFSRRRSPQAASTDSRNCSPPYHHRCANETRHLHHQCTHLHQMVYTRQQATITEGTSRSAITNMAPSASRKLPSSPSPAAPQLTDSDKSNRPRLCSSS